MIKNQFVYSLLKINISPTISKIIDGAIEAEVLALGYNTNI